MWKLTTRKSSVPYARTKKPDQRVGRLYSDENFPHLAVEALRTLGHDVLTSLEAKRANRRIPDAEVLRDATELGRAVITLNRRDFMQLHRITGGQHPGIIVCTTDNDFAGQARRIHEAILGAGDLASKLIRVNRPAK
jgi:hypothetical protein